MPISKEVLCKHKETRLFVETGSFRGDGIQVALDCGFEKVISIELSPLYYDHCQRRFAGHDKVFLYHGDSEELLGQLIDGINEPMTFWLDAHYSCEKTALGKHWTPLMFELDVILGHPVTNHVIMIDDMFCWQEPNATHGFCVVDIMSKLSPQFFTHVLEDGYRKNDILVAKRRA